jgi:hypothetical protein
MLNVQNTVCHHPNLTRQAEWDIKTHYRVQLRLDGTHAETRFRLLAKQTSPCDSVGVTVQLTTGS